MAEQMQEALIRACDAAIPKKKWHYRSVPWWTPELTRAKREVYRARRKYQGARDPATREQEKLRYRDIRKEYVKAITKVKIQSCEKFVSKEGNKEPWSISFRTVTGKLRRKETVSILRTP